MNPGKRGLLIGAGMLFSLQVLLSSGVAAPPLKVVICAGQSNMVGRASVAAELSPELQGEQENLFFDGKDWVTLKPGLMNMPGFGPEISLARKLSAELKEPVGIIKHALGGMNLAVQWAPRDQDGKRPSDGLYAELLQKVDAAKKSRPLEIVAMAWMQGEADAKAEAMANAYAKNLERFIAVSREDFGVPAMLFVAGRIFATEERFPFRAAVRKAQESCPASRYAFVDGDSLPLLQDKTHLATPGTVALGERFAEAILTLLRKPEAK